MSADRTHATGHQGRAQRAPQATPQANALRHNAIGGHAPAPAAAAPQATPQVSAYLPRP